MDWSGVDYVWIFVMFLTAVWTHSGSTHSLQKIHWDFEACVDGAHCFSVLCSHLCCWDTERRCTRGIRSHAPARVRKHALKNEDFPSLSIVNVSEWAGRGRPIKERPLYGADTEVSLNDVSCVSLTKQTKDTQRANLSFPDIRLPTSSTLSDKPNNMVKLNTVHISPLMGRSELPQCPVVTWIPNPHHEPQWLHQNKSKFPNIAVKELVCRPSCQMTKPSIVANRRKKCNGRKRRGARVIKCTLEGAGSPRWVGIGFNPIPKITHNSPTAYHSKIFYRVVTKPFRVPMTSIVFFVHVGQWKSMEPKTI